MNTFDTHREQLADKLTAAGLTHVTLDPGALPPFVLVDLVTINGASGVGAWSASVAVRCVVPPPGDAAAARALGDMLEVVLTTLGGAPAVPGTLPVGGKDCPAYKIVYPAQIPNPNC